jgi:hypothetical protein
MNRLSMSVLLSARSIRSILTIALCVTALTFPHREAFGQWRQAKGFSNAIGDDQVKGFYSYGKLLLADANCPSNQPGATSDSLFLSKDDGLTWTDFSSNGGLPLLAIGNQSAPLILGLADTAPGSFSALKWLEYSSNMGHTWVTDTLGWPVPNGMPMTMISMGNTIFIGSAYGVAEQTEPGARWTLDTVGMTIGMGGQLFTYPVTALLASGNTMFAAAGFYGGMYISNNNGKSWMHANNGLPSVPGSGGMGWLPVWGMAQSGSSVITMVAHDSTNISYDFYRTANNGQNWVRINSTPLILGANLPQMVASGNNIFIESYDKGIFVSTDQGKTWTQANQGLPGFAPDLAAKNSGIGPSFMGIQISGGNLMVGSESGVWVRKLSDFGIH